MCNEAQTSKKVPRAYAIVGLRLNDVGSSSSGFYKQHSVDQIPDILQPIQRVIHTFRSEQRSWDYALNHVHSRMRGPLTCSLFGI
jgi:hypothetical protein